MWGEDCTLRVFFILLNFCFPNLYSTFPANTRWKEYASLCPYNNLCTANATKHQTAENQHFVPCCQQCSCEPDCQEYGICCPDAPYPSQSPDADVEFPCVDLKTVSNSPREIKVTSRYDVTFHVVDRCPNSTMADKYKACQKRSDLRDYVVVTDVMNGRVYQNSHCADCNGVQQYVEWDIITECHGINDIGFETFEERNDYIMEHCSIIPVPPESHKTSLFRCFPENVHITDTCEHLYGQKPIKIDGETKTACETDMSGVNTLFHSDQSRYGQMFQSGVFYKNIYCYLCTKQHHLPVSKHLCEKRPYTYDDSRNSRVNMMLLLSFTSHLVSEPKAARCNMTSIWDRYSDSCLKLVCPDTSIPYHGVCRHGILQSTGVTFIAIFNIEIERPISMPQSFMSLNEGVTSAFGDYMPCGRCGTVIGRSRNTSNLYLLYYLYTQENCTRDDLLARVAHVFKQSITITVPNITHSTSTQVSLTSYTHLPDDLDILAHDRSRSLCLYSKPITPYILQNCARIDTRMIPFKYQIESTPAITEKMINNTLCVRDYFVYMESLQKNQATSQQVIQCCYLWLVLLFLMQASSVLNV